MLDLTQEKATQLMLRTCVPPHIRVVDDLLLLDEGKAAANAIFGILRNDYEWSFPSTDKLQATWQDNRGKSRCKRAADEDEKQYKMRMKKWITWPEYKTTRQFQWLRCAIITSNALHYLQQCHDNGLALHVEFTEGRYYEYAPKQFYEYIWICLNQGYGRQQWKCDPPNSLVSGQASTLLVSVVDRWEQGMDLGTQYPLKTPQKLLSTPYHKNVISDVRGKCRKYLAQEDEGDEGELIRAEKRKVDSA